MAVVVVVLRCVRMVCVCVCVCVCSFFGLLQVTRMLLFVHIYSIDLLIYFMLFCVIFCFLNEVMVVVVVVVTVV